MKKIILALFAIMILPSCSRYNGQYDAISTKTISLYDINRPKEVVERNAIATSSRHVLILLVPSGRAPTISETVEEMLTKYNGDYLKNVEIRHNSFQIMWLYHYTAWKVTGDVVRIRR